MRSVDGDPGDVSDDDVALLRAWAAGDREAGNRLFRRYFGPVFRFFESKTGAAADELTQRTFLGALESAARVDPTRGFRGYLFGIARNQLLMFLREYRRDHARFDPQTWSVVDVGLVVARAAEIRREQELIDAALHTIPIDYQCALEFHYWHGLEVREVAEALGVPEGTIKARLSRGRKLLREALERAGAQAPDLLGTAVAELERWLQAQPAAFARHAHDSGDRR